MKVLHVLAGADIGGIERLVESYQLHARNENYFAFICGSGPIAESMKKQGLNVYVFKVNSKKLLKEIIKIRKFVLDNSFDVCVFHHASPYSHICNLVFYYTIKKYKSVIYAHGHIDDMLRKNISNGLLVREFILRKSIAKSCGVIAISKMVRDSIIQAGVIQKDKVRVVYNGVDLSKFIFDKKCNDKLDLIYVGRLIPQKGVKYIILAMNQLKLKYGVSSRLSIVGDGTDKPYLEKLTSDCGLERYVEFMGKRDDVDQLLKKSNCFIHMPVWEEGFGITIIEAMASGLTCFCAKRGAIPEIIEHERDGYLVPPEDEDTLCDYLYRYLNCSSSEVESINDAARKKVALFSIERYSEHFEDVLKDFINI